MYIASAITAILACSTVAALPLPNSPQSSPEHDDFAFQLLNSRKRVLELSLEAKFSSLAKSESHTPIVEKFSFFAKSGGRGPHEKRSWFDLLAIPDLAMRIKQWKEDGHP
jgi:hypothetical protein